MSELPAPPEPIEVFEGEGGVRVEIHDESRPYGYANLYHARLRVVARFPEAAEAYERVLERLGVIDAQLPAARRDLIENFKASALPYLFHAGFSRRLSEHRARKRPKVVSFRGGPA